MRRRRIRYLQMMRQKTVFQQRGSQDMPAEYKQEVYWVKASQVLLMYQLWGRVQVSWDSQLYRRVHFILMGRQRGMRNLCLL